MKYDCISLSKWNLLTKKFISKEDLLQTHWFGEMYDSSLALPIQCRFIQAYSSLPGKGRVTKREELGF